MSHLQQLSRKAKHIDNARHSDRSFDSRPTIFIMTVRNIKYYLHIIQSNDLRSHESSHPLHLTKDTFDPLFLRIFDPWPIYHEEASMASASTGQFMPPALLANQRCHQDKMLISLQALLLLDLLTSVLYKIHFSRFWHSKEPQGSSPAMKTCLSIPFQPRICIK